MLNISVILSFVVTVLPALFGVIKWKTLPDVLAIHFDLSGKPNGFAPKIFVVAVLPLILLACQIFSVAVTKYSKADASIGIVLFTSWFIAIISLIVSFAIYRYALK